MHHLFESFLIALKMDVHMYACICMNGNTFHDQACLDMTQMHTRTCTHTNGNTFHDQACLDMTQMHTRTCTHTNGNMA